METKAIVLIILLVAVVGIFAQPLSVEIEMDDTVICEQLDSIAFPINVTTTGGAPPYEYMWAPWGAYVSGHIEDIIAIPPLGVVTEYVIMAWDAAGDTAYDTVYVSAVGPDAFAAVDVEACPFTYVEVGCPSMGIGGANVVWRTLDGDSVGAGPSFWFLPETTITLVAEAVYSYCPSIYFDTVLVEMATEPPGPFAWWGPVPDDTLPPGMVELCWSMPPGDTPIYFDVILDGYTEASWITDTCYDVGPFPCGESHSWYIEAYNICDYYSDGCGISHYDSTGSEGIQFGDTFSGGFDPPFHTSPCDSTDTLGYPAGYFYIIQGSDTFCVEPYLVDVATESLWFNYTSSSMHTGVEEAYKSKAFFFYNEHTGNMGILVVHNIDVTGTTDATCEMYFIDLPPGAALAVSDDPGEFDLSAWPQGDWAWWNNTDGGAAYLPRAEWKFAIDHTWGGLDPITSWWFLSGATGGTEIPLSMTLGDTLYLGHGFLQLLPYPSDYIVIDSVTAGVDSEIEVIVHNSDETIDTLYIGGVDNTDPHFVTSDFPPILGPDDWGTIALDFFSADTGMFCDTIWALTNEPCGTNPIVVCVHATAPPVEAEIVEPLPETWTSCEGQPISMTIASEGEMTLRLDIPSGSWTTEYWDTTTSAWLPAVDISYSGWGSYLFEGSSWIWDSVYTGGITGRRLTFRTLVETPDGTIIDSAFVSMYADNSAIFYMNGDSVGADDDGATWNHMFTFDLTSYMHGGIDTMTVLGIDLTGVAVGVDFLVSVFYRVDCGLDLSSIDFVVNGIYHTVGDGFLDFVDPDYLIFTPFGAELFEDGDIVTACLDSLENFCDGYLAEPICWDFFVDLAAPFIENSYPPIDTFVAEPIPTISTDVIDLGSGVDTSTLVFTVSDSVIAHDDFSLTPVTGGWTIEYTPASPIMTADTIWVCVSATDTTDYCPDNVMDTCWYFFNMSPREVWFPTVFGAPCDTVLIPLIIDGLDYSWIGTADFAFRIDPEIAIPLGIITTGSLTDGWGVAGLVVDPIAGTVSATIAGSPLYSGGEGDFLYLEVQIPCNARGGSYTNVEIDTIWFNEGVPEVSWTHGLLAVELLPQAFTCDIRLNRTILPTEDYVVTFTALPGATDNYDPGLDIQQVPPPDWFVDGWFTLDDTIFTHISKLIRDAKAVAPPVTWYLATSDEPNGIARWDPTRFPEGEFRINGLVDMKRDSVAYFSTDDTLVIEWFMPELQAGELSFEPGWNLVSCPLLPDGHTANEVFATTMGVFRYITPLSAYDFAYTIRDGEGYWVWADSVYSIPLIGGGIDGYRRQVYRGWNMIGSALDTIPISGIDVVPSGSIVGDIFGYDGVGYYPATEIIPGKGYWLLSNNEGVLHAPTGYRRRLAPPISTKWTGSISVGGEVLTIGYAPNAADGIGEGDIALPPIAPNGDARQFALIADGFELTRDVSPNGRWELLLRSESNIEFGLPEDILISVDGAEFADGEIVTLGPGSYKLQSRSLLPESFKVIGCVPNPFNSSADFVIALPVSGPIEIEIFDISGRLVKSKSTEVGAGIIRIPWDGKNNSGMDVPSGLYFGRITFGEDTGVIKAMLIK